MDYDPTTEKETPWEDKGIDHDDDSRYKRRILAH